MSAGLCTSTSTRGRMAPEVSLTTPAMLLCANATRGSNRSPNDDAITIRTTRVRPIETSLGERRGLFGHGGHRRRLREPGGLDGDVRLHLAQLDRHLHVRLRHRSLERELDAGDVTIIAVVHLRRNKADGRARPAHHPDEQAGVVEV